MALGATIQSLAQGTSPTGQFRAVGFASSEWQTVVDAGRVATADAATITNPLTDITNSATHIFSRQCGAGTYLRVRLKYASGINSGITSPVVKVFGRSLSNPASGAGGVAGPWQLLKNMNGGSLNSTLTVDPTNDARDGTFSYTTADALLHSWDVDGCSEFLIGVETAFAGTGGSTSTATIEAKFI